MDPSQQETAKTHNNECSKSIGTIDYIHNIFLLIPSINYPAEPDKTHPPIHHYPLDSNRKNRT